MVVISLFSYLDLATCFIFKQILMNVLLAMVDVKCIVLIQMGHLHALVIIMKYLMLQDYSVLVGKKWCVETFISLYSASDHDECATDSHDCEQVCQNTVPYWTCGCNAGYLLRSDGRTCQGNNLSLSAVANYHKFNYLKLLRCQRVFNKQWRVCTYLYKLYW